MKFLKTIRFDPSDNHVFELAAEQDEWAISGGFWFAGITRPELKGKVKQAFSNGFLSIESFGFSTFTSVTEISPLDVEQITDQLAKKLASDFGAPSLEAAKAAAQEEINYIAGMCDKVSINKVFAIKRTLDEHNEIRESFSLMEKSSSHADTKIWEIVDD